jgi:CheY-like chemotaxis protein
VDSIKLEDGADPDEILSFARLIALRESDPVPNDVRYKALAGLPHIRVNEVSYKKVGADEAVVTKEEAPSATTDEGMLLQSLLGPGATGHSSDQLIGKLIQDDPQGLGRAIQTVAASARDPVSGEMSGGNIALQILERAALKISATGAGFPELQERISDVARDFPPEILSALSGGEKGDKAKNLIARFFSPKARTRIFADSLMSEMPMASLEETLASLRREGEDLLPLVEGAAIAFRDDGLPFMEASPYLLDMLELTRRIRRQEVEQAKRPEERTSRFEFQQAPLAVIADAATYHEFYQSALGDSGYRLQFHTDGQDALETILRDGPALLILDFKLTGIDGLDLIRRLRRKNVAPPLVIVTGQTGLTHEFEVKTYPNHRIVKKPPNIEALQQAVQDIKGSVDETETEKEEFESLPSGVLKFLEKSSLREKINVKGFEFGTNLDFGPGSEAIFVDSFLLHGGRSGLFVAGCSQADEDSVLLLSLFQAALRIVSPWATSGKTTLIQSAGLLGTDGINQIPIVCQTLVIDPSTGKVTLCTAGAPPPLRFLSENKKVRKVGSGGIAVGRLLRGGLGRVLEEERVKLDPGDLLIMTSWSVLNGSNPQSVRFGPESVGGLLLTAKNTNPTTAASRISQGVKRHIGGAPLGATAVLAVRRE